MCYLFLYLLCKETYFMRMSGVKNWTYLEKALDQGL